MIRKTRTYKVGDAVGNLVWEPHGRRTYRYRHYGYEFGYILYMYKDGQPIFVMSLHPEVYVAYVKAIVKVVAETSMPENVHVRRSTHYWLMGKTWLPPGSSTASPILRGEIQRI